MNTTDTLLTVTVILLAIVQLAVLLVSIKLLLTIKKATDRFHKMVGNLDKSVSFAKDHLSKQWPVISLLSWGIRKVKHGGTS